MGLQMIAKKLAIIAVILQIIRKRDSDVNEKLIPGREDPFSVVHLRGHAVRVLLAVSSLESTIFQHFQNFDFFFEKFLKFRPQDSGSNLFKRA